ncbi:hypothetical protein GEMRC1_007069 [Eukaryota sp. GEM-RC1]
MILRCDLFHRLYEDIKSHTPVDRSSVLLFVGPGVDSLCAAHILSSTLSSDRIFYSQVAVTSQHHLIDVFNRHASLGPDLRTVFFINCGAGLRLRQLLKPHPQIKFIVIDSARPVSLINAFEQRQIILVDDIDNGIQRQINNIQAKFDKEGDAIDSESEVEESYSVDSESFSYDSIRDDYEAVFSGAQSQPPYKRVRSEDDDVVTVGLLSHHRIGLKAPVVEAYYNLPTSFGSPTSLLLCRSLQLSRPPLVWAACVGSREYHVLDRCSQNDWELSLSELNQLVATAIQNHQDYVYDEEEGTRRPDSLFEISRSEEYAFCLLAFSSLKQAIENTPSFSARLALHKDTGRTLLATVLPKIGISLKDFETLFNHMSHTSKENLDNYWQESVDIFKLPSFKHQEFSVKRPGRHPITSSDLVYVLLYILMFKKQEGLSSFSLANKLLMVPDEALLMKYVKETLELISEVSKICRTVLAENFLRHNGYFYDVRLDRIPSDLFFDNPFALMLLAHFLQVSVSYRSVYSKKVQDLPIVLSILSSNHENPRYLVGGKVNTGSTKNFVGQCFLTMIATDEIKKRFQLEEDF